MVELLVPASHASSSRLVTARRIRDSRRVAALASCSWWPPAFGTRTHAEGCWKVHVLVCRQAVFLLYSRLRGATATCTHISYPARVGVANDACDAQIHKLVYNP